MCTLWGFYIIGYVFGVLLPFIKEYTTNITI